VYNYLLDRLKHVLLLLLLLLLLLSLLLLLLLLCFKGLLGWLSFPRSLQPMLTHGLYFTWGVGYLTCVLRYLTCVLRYFTPVDYLFIQCIAGSAFTRVVYV
jgi:hypothetical protein